MVKGVARGERERVTVLTSEIYRKIRWRSWSQRRKKTKGDFSINKLNFSRERIFDLSFNLFKIRFYAFTTEKGQ